MSGPLRGTTKTNVVTMPDAGMQFGSQKWWWGIARDAQQRAVSMRSYAMPNIVLWNRIGLNFRWAEAGG